MTKSSLSAAAAKNDVESLLADVADICDRLRNMPDRYQNAIDLAENLKRELKASIATGSDSDIAYDSRNYVEALERQVTLLSASLSLRGGPKKLVDRSPGEADALLAMRNDLDTLQTSLLALRAEVANNWTTLKTLLREARQSRCGSAAF